jgi:chromosome segregation ATPase
MNLNQAGAFAILGILGAVPTFAQANPADSPTLQAILTEVRAIHNEVRLSQTTQLLLTELEIQQTAVDRAIQRRDDLRSKVRQIQIDQKDVSGRLANFPENFSEATAQETKDAADMRESLRGSLEGLKAQELDRQNDLQDAESALRRQQATLDGIEAQLSDVVRKLQPASTQ